MAAIIVPVVSGGSPDELVLRAAAAAYLGRYRGQSRVHSESDLRVFLRWCAEQDLHPLTAVRVDVQRYLRWLQDVRRYRPSTVSRRLSVVVGFYRVCVIDGILALASRPRPPTHRARRVANPGTGTSPVRSLITAARLSANPNDFALIALLCLPPTWPHDTSDFAAPMNDIGR